MEDGATHELEDEVDDSEVVEVEVELGVELELDDEDVLELDDEEVLVVVGAIQVDVDFDVVEWVVGLGLSWTKVGTP